jgi:hypothetical protein
MLLRLRTLDPLEQLFLETAVNGIDAWKGKKDTLRPNPTN